MLQLGVDPALDLQLVAEPGIVGAQPVEFGRHVIELGDVLDDGGMIGADVGMLVLVGALRHRHGGGLGHRLLAVIFSDQHGSLPLG